jgi:hypothetical protein
VVEKRESVEPCSDGSVHKEWMKVRLFFKSSFVLVISYILLTGTCTSTHHNMSLDSSRESTGLPLLTSNSVA